MQYSLVSLSYLLYVLSPISSVYQRDIQVPQAVKNVSASYDALIDLFASFENFLGRLSIYIGVPLTPALTNILVKIIAELLSTLALATKQVKQGRLSAFVLIGMTLDLTQRREIYEEALWRERHRGDSPETRQAHPG